MAAIRTILSSILLCGLGLQAQTTLSGPIDEVVFSPERNPYIIQKDITVSKGKTVVIAPGCVLLFNSFTGLQVFGQIIVKGSEGGTIVFSSINDRDFNPAATQLPNPFDWNGVFIAPESDGGFFNNFSLRYSVYGIKSQSNNVIIQNGIFQQNGQFHFTINDQIQYVQDNIPFSYGKPAEMNGQASGKKPDKTASTTPNKKLILRIAGLSVGAAGIGAGTVFAVLAVRENRELVKIRDNSQEYSPEKWKEVEDRQRTNTVISAVGYGLGVLGLAGFGLTFVF